MLELRGCHRRSVRSASGAGTLAVWRCAAWAVVVLLLAGCTSPPRLVAPANLPPAPTAASPGPPVAKTLFRAPVASRDATARSGSQESTALRKMLRPSNDRDWSPDQAVLAHADVTGDRVTIHNIRDCTYFTAENYVVRHFDKTYELSKLESVDFIMVPFADMPGIAHTMLSFGFGQGEQVAVSVEVRKERGEKWNAVNGFFRQYELMYVLATERDLIGLRANHHLNDVYVYRARATRDQARALLLDVIQRVNKLVEQPEFYDTLANNCTSNIVRHINHLKPNRVPLDYRVLLPAYSDRLAYDLGLLDTDLSFEETKARARVNYQAYAYRDDSDFSARIRR